MVQRDNGRFYIIDGLTEKSTLTTDSTKAEIALARYILDRGNPNPVVATPRDNIDTVAQALERYNSEHAPQTKDPKRIGYAVKALVPILGGMKIADLNANACRQYGEERGVSNGTVRKELGTLQAAINHCVREGYLAAGKQLTLPTAPPPRDRWLTGNEFEALLKAAESKPETRHVARFILIAVYTGTRSKAILGLKFSPHNDGGWIDTANGMMYRRAEGEAETKKRTPTIRIPPSLLSHLKQWEKEGAEWAVEYRGARVMDIKKAWANTVDSAGIDPVNKHDLRHTCATWMMRAGADKWAVAGYLGMTVEMLESTYGHHHPDHMKSAVDAIDQIGK